MKKFILLLAVIVFCFFVSVSAQVPISTLAQISKAEDELRYDKTLEDLVKNSNAKIRERAALAAGRIGDERAVSALTNLLKTDKSEEVRAMGAFALGEIESIKAADSILNTLGQQSEVSPVVIAKSVEAAGKIAVANSKEENSKKLGQAILNVLENVNKSANSSAGNIILLGLTAILRAKPVNGEITAAKFLTNSDGRIRADAANTLSRLRAKNANEQLRKILSSDVDPIARANAARALGAAEDKEAFNILLESAVSDQDLRVRVSAIRSLGSLKNKQAADKLLERGEKLLTDYKKSKFANPFEKNELLEISTALGNNLLNSDDLKTFTFLRKFREAENFKSPEISIALARVSPEAMADTILPKNADWQMITGYVQGLGELANAENTGENKPRKEKAIQVLNNFIKESLSGKEKREILFPSVLSAYGKFKTEHLTPILLAALNQGDIFTRAAAAQLLSEQPANIYILEALQIAFSKSLLTDRDHNDAQFAILSALVKLDKTRAIGQLSTALDHYDYLVRRHAANLIKENDLLKDFPKLGETEAKVGTVKNYDEKFKSKLGQVLNSEKDYLRAVSRKNGSIKAVFTTEKGSFTIEFLPEDAPLTVDNFVKLANSGYFNGIAFHRVVPNFVVQDGDPRGDGSGGPGWSIRDEMNTVPYQRGTVGMALSGKNTGGSQWFVTHSPQPHLDGGYTVFGKVNEIDMKIVDNLVRGDKILNVKIIERRSSK